MNSNDIIGNYATVGHMYNIPKDALKLNVIEKIRKDLTMIPKVPDFVPKKKSAGENTIAGFYAFGETDTHISVPRFYGVQKWGCPRPENIQVCEGVPMHSDVQFIGELRDDPPQKKAFEAITQALCGKESHNKIGGAMAQLPCGYGKTILAIAIAVHLKRRTMVFVHKEFLMKQWVARIKSFAPNAKVGIVQQKKIQIKDMDIVVAMVQSVAGKDYPKELLETIGFLVIDESHHMAAQFFSQAIPKIPCKYVLGLSATPRRSDGLQRLLEWSMGKIAFAVERKTENVRIVQMIYENGQQKELTARNGTNLRPQMINALVAERARNAVILEILVSIMTPFDMTQFKNGTLFDLLSEESLQLVLCKLKKRKVLVLTDRLDHIDVLLGAVKQILGVKCYSYGKYIGGMSELQRDASAECSIIFGTYSMASEGLDIPALDTLILASPKCDIEQSVGRILRPCYGKQTPVVIDIVDPFSYFQNYGWRRRSYYLKQKYSIIRESHLTFLPKLRNWLSNIDFPNFINAVVDNSNEINEITEITEENHKETSFW